MVSHSVMLPTGTLVGDILLCVDMWCFDHGSSGSKSPPYVDIYTRLEWYQIKDRLLPCSIHLRLILQAGHNGDILTRLLLLSPTYMMQRHGRAFPALSAFLWGNHRWMTITKGQLCRALVFYLLLSWASCWTNSGVAGDSRRQGAQVTSL